MYFRLFILSSIAAGFLGGCSILQSDENRWIRQGPHEVRVNDETALYDVIQDREVSLRVTWPSGAGPYPVVVFSHGAFCYPQQYGNVTDFWVSHGYVVIFPNHLDSPNGPKMGPRALSKMLTARSQDMSFVLDSFDQLEQQIPELRGSIDRDRAAAAGHSFGGMIAMIKSGLKMQDQRSGELLGMADDRFQALVVMSGVGQMEPTAAIPAIPMMTTDAFSGLTGPLIASGGSLDEGNVGSGVTYPWQWRMSAYTEAPADDKYYLALDNADHYLGGLICRSNKGGEADPLAVEVVRSAQTAFLDAYVKGDQRALGWLRSNNFFSMSEGRATFDYK